MGAMFVYLGLHPSMPTVTSHFRQCISTDKGYFTGIDISYSLLNNTSGSEGIPSVQILWLIYNIHEEKNDCIISQQNNNVVMINH